MRMAQDIAAENGNVQSNIKDIADMFSNFVERFTREERNSREGSNLEAKLFLP